MRYLTGICCCLTIALALSYADATACQCYGEITPAEAYEKADLVVEGVVLSSVEPGPRPFVENGDTAMVISSGDMIRWRIAVSELRKGSTDDTLSVYSARWGMSCGVEFAIGGHYLIYAQEWQSIQPGLIDRVPGTVWPEGTEVPLFRVGMCGGTIALRDRLWNTPE